DVCSSDLVDAPLLDRGRDRPRPRAETGGVMRARGTSVERKHDVDAVLLRLRGGPLQEGELRDFGRTARIPGDRPALLGEVRALEHAVEPGTAVVGELAGVVGDAVGDARRVDGCAGASAGAD